MKKVVSLLVIFCLILVATGISSAQTKNASDWDILGIKFGSSYNDVVSALKANIKSVNIIPHKGTVNFKGQTSSELLFGLDANSKRTNNIDYPLDKITVAFAPESNGGVVGILRTMRFTKNDGPSVDSVRASLIAKYGNPSREKKKSSESVFLFWQQDASASYDRRSILFKNTPEQDVTVCERSISEMSRGSISYAPNLKNEGRILGCYIFEESMNNELTSRIEFTFIDNIAASESAGRLINSLQEGATNRMNQLKEQNDKVRPKF